MLLCYNRVTFEIYLKPSLYETLDGKIGGHGATVWDLHKLLF